MPFSPTWIGRLRKNGLNLNDGGRIMGKWQRLLSACLLLLLLIVAGKDSALAVPDPDAIQWLAPPNQFVVSLYNGVLATPIYGNNQVNKQSKHHVELEALLRSENVLLPDLKEPGQSVSVKKDLVHSPEKELQGQFLIALGDDDLEEAKRLMEQGVDVNQPLSQTGQTPLMAAESRQMAELLLNHGADVSQTDADGGTVLHYTISRDKALELIPLFVSHGADINTKGWDKQTPLMVAVTYLNEIRKNQESQTQELLLNTIISNGADINIFDDYGNNALILATIQDNYQLVELLLKLGADPKLKGPNGDTAKDYAYELGHRRIYQLLE
jgi:ankyrin repeat protein